MAVHDDAIAAVGVPADTSADAHALQAAIYRQRGGAERMRIALRLSAMARELAIAGIRSRNPEYSQDQVRRAYMRLMQGDDVAQRMWPDQPLVQP